ncbi:uncharacterized protein LOC131983404 [Centropristis striata]|uniref:uncharacterized protein LOC131983404 n=1 Tax=Centropristis striata TaxID=184440 RepID=UPI0027E0D2E2|nr:uncharacterized protein LOC131983404 [Centropristis striata]
MAQRKKERERKKNFSEAEIEVILGEVESKKNILFSSVSSGVTGTGKAKAWREVTDAVNVVSVVQRTTAEVKRKWFDIKLDAKKRISAHKKSASATGGGRSESKLSVADERIAGIIGETSLSGIIPEGDSDMPALESTSDAGECSSHDVAFPASAASAASTPPAAPAASAAPRYRGRRGDPPVLTEEVLRNQEALLCRSVGPQKLRRRFTTAPILTLPDPQRQFVVEVHASNEGVGAVLSQRSERDSKMHPCAFLSRWLSRAERNYDVGNRELLAVKLALEEWRHWLEGAEHPFIVWTNYKRNIETSSPTSCPTCSILSLRPSNLKLSFH